MGPARARWNPVPTGSANPIRRSRDLLAAPHQRGVQEVVEVLVVREDDVAAHVEREALGGHIRARQAWTPGRGGRDRGAPREIHVPSSRHADRRIHAAGAGLPHSDHAMQAIRARRVFRYRRGPHPPVSRWSPRSAMTRRHADADASRRPAPWGPPQLPAPGRSDPDRPPPRHSK